jgi:hypothetical protein
MTALDDPVYVGDQALIGVRRGVADARAAGQRLAEVGSGRALGRGDVGRDAVKVLQRALVALGYSTSRSQGTSDGAAVIDGDFGAGTERGVRQFQAEVPLEVDGRVGGATLAALDSAAQALLDAMDPDARRRQRDVLDGTISLSAADLKGLYRPAIAGAATGAAVKEEVVAAIMVVESAGGGWNRPKFESHHRAALMAMRDRLQGQRIDSLSSQKLGALARSVKELDAPAGENGVRTKMHRALVDAMVGDGGTEGRRTTLATIQSWSERELRELATSWGWGQIMGWHTLEPAFVTARITLPGLKSQHPAQQIATLGKALLVEESWARAVRKADNGGNYAPFAQAYNGAPIGSPTNNRYAAAMRQAAAEYRSA